MIGDGFLVQRGNPLRPEKANRENDESSNRKAGVGPSKDNGIPRRSSLGGGLFFPQCGLDAGFEEGGGLETGRFQLDELNYFLFSGQFLLARGAAGQMLFKLEARGQIQLAVPVRP